MRKILIGFLCSFPLLCQAQSLEQVIRLAQDSTIAAFRSRYEYEYHQQHFARFEALRKPQLELRLTPNYYNPTTTNWSRIPPGTTCTSATTTASPHRPS